MTYPIDIPAQQSYRQIPTADLSPYPEDEGPYMGYTEIFENGLVHNLVSAGSGRFVEVQPQFKLPFFSFTIVKHNARGVTTIGFGSRDLKRFFSESLALNPVGPEPLTLNIEQVLCHYDALCQLLRERANYGTRFDDTFNEIRLLVNDILLESFLYDGLDINHLHRQNIISADLFREIQPRYNDFGLSGPEEYFELGAFTQEMEEEYERVQNTQIGTFARMGREDLLRGFCEPLLRSKNTRIFYDEELLYDILQTRFWDTYEYMLNVIERSHLLEKNVRRRDPSDITYDPLYMAIKLGHCPTVQYLIQNKHKNFEGYIKGAVSYSDRLFTPLLAAVRWQKVDVIRLLLREAPVYYSMLPQAFEFAKETGFDRMLDVVEDLTEENASTFAHKSARYPGPKAPQAQLSGVVPPSITITPSPYGNSNVSGISNGFQDLSQGQTTLDGPEPFPHSPEISQLLTNPSFEGKDLGSFDSGIGMENSFEFPTSPWTSPEDGPIPHESIEQPTGVLSQLSSVPIPPSWGDDGPLLAEDSDFEKFVGQPTEALDPTSPASTRENKRPRLEMDFNFEAISSETTETPGQRDLTPIPSDNKRPRLAMKFNFEAISGQATKTPGQSSPDPPPSTQDYNGPFLVTVSDFDNAFARPADAQDQMIQSPFLLSFNDNGPATGFDVVNMSNGFTCDANGSIAPSAFPTPSAFSTSPTENVEDVLLQTDIPPWTPQCKDDHPTPSKTELIGEPPSSSLKCGDCGKTFSNVSNRNKHERDICRNKTIPRPPCRYAHLGCTKTPTNNDNRKNHEKKWCKFSPNRLKAGGKKTT